MMCYCKSLDVCLEHCVILRGFSGNIVLVQSFCIKLKGV